MGVKAPSRSERRRSINAETYSVFIPSRRCCSMVVSRQARHCVRIRLAVRCSMAAMTQQITKLAASTAIMPGGRSQLSNRSQRDDDNRQQRKRIEDETVDRRGARRHHLHGRPNVVHRIGWCFVEQRPILLNFCALLRSTAPGLIRIALAKPGKSL